MQLNKILSFIIGKPVGSKRQPLPPHLLSAHKRSIRLHNLLRREAEVGATVFGPIPKGHAREFFCLDQYTWVWSERWVNQETGLTEQMVVRYEFNTHGVLKIVNDVPRGYLKGDELKNLLRAMKTYTERIHSEVYGHAPITV